MKKKCALISVYNKKNIQKICEVFLKNNIDIISTGNTANYIRNLGYKCFLISDLIKANEILDGRVKTFHPNIYASLLFDRKNNEHINTFKKIKFPIIDYLIVNLYPFEEFIKKNMNKKIEMIDIGGPSLLRAAAKNFNSVTAISNIEDYDRFISDIQNNKGSTSLELRKEFAAKVFAITSKYDNAIKYWLDNKSLPFESDHFSSIKLRYGENPHQDSSILFKKNNKTFNDFVISGKKLSYNNILDIESAYNCLQEFNETTCVIIKHNNPCGVCSNKNPIKAFNKAYSSDPVSSFGGILGINKKIDLNLSKKISKYFFEVLIAKDFTKDALNYLKKNKKIIIIKYKFLKYDPKDEIKSINGGHLIQEKNKIKFSARDMKSVSNKTSSKKEIDDLIFAFRVCKHVKSNAIVLAKNKQTVGIGAGQMSRIDATKLAIMKTNKKHKKIGFVAASDAFFPFTDNIKKLLNNNCRAIIQPKGSINDLKIINYVNKKNIPLYFAKYRFFKH